MNFYSNGKLLITGEYTVLDGAKALAIPTRFGQSMEISTLDKPIINWVSLDENEMVWFECELDIYGLKLINSNFYSQEENPTENTAETLQSILVEAQKLHPKFLTEKIGFQVTTKLTFPRNWGLGSSSTLINNCANWAEVDAYKLLKNTFGGSGYDIACAQHNSPITYQLNNDFPKIELVDFNPKFKKQLYFIHLNQKQDSRKGIAQYRKAKKNSTNDIEEISILTDELLNVSDLKSFEKIVQQHERIISKMIDQQPIKEVLFSDYFGQIKSLGAWGGDFILVTGNESTPNYFNQKGYKTIIPFEEMIL